MTATEPEGDIGLDMILRFVLFVFMRMSLLTRMNTSSGSDDLTTQRDALSKAFEEPLRVHLLMKGYTPRNAAIATNSLLDTYAQCLADTPRTDLSAEPDVMSFWLGDAVVSAYKSPCVSEFIKDVGGLPQP